MYQPSKFEVIAVRVATGIGASIGILVAVAAFASHVAAFG
jgi:hypothetical protein